MTQLDPARFEKAFEAYSEADNTLKGIEAAIRSYLSIANADRWIVQPFGPGENGIAIIEERAGTPPGGTPTNGIQAWVPLWPSECENDDCSPCPDRALRVASVICDAVNGRLQEHKR